MITNGLFTRPHRLLLARFFSQGLVVAAIVTFAVGAVLTWQDCGNHVEHAVHYDCNRQREVVAGRPEGRHR